MPPNRISPNIVVTLAYLPVVFVFFRFPPCFRAATVRSATESEFSFKNGRFGRPQFFCGTNF